MPRRYGRPATTATDKVGVYLPNELRKRAAIEAIKREVTLSDLVAQALTAFLAPKRRESIAPALPGLDEPDAGQVKGEQTP